MLIVVTERCPEKETKKGEAKICVLCKKQQQDYKKGGDFMVGFSLQLTTNITRVTCTKRNSFIDALAEMIESWLKR